MVSSDAMDKAGRKNVPVAVNVIWRLFITLVASVALGSFDVSENKTSAESESEDLCFNYFTVTQVIRN